MTLLATIVPAALGQVAYSSAVAVTLIGTLAIIFTAGYAAENLKEFRKATEAEYTPVIDASLNQVYRRDARLTILVSLLNIGRGTAARVEATLWWMDSDLTVWTPHRIDELDHLLRPGAETETGVESPWVRLAIHHEFRSDVPALILQVRYNSPLGAQEDFIPYDLAADEDDLQAFVRSQ